MRVTNAKALDRIICWSGRGSQVTGAIVASSEVNRRWTLAVALAMSVTSSFAADVAKGSLHFGKTKFQPVDAIAYQEAGKDGTPVTIIAFSDFKIDRQGVMEAINTVSAFLNQINTNQKGKERTTTERRSGAW